jgi:hypothetical protein
MAEENLCCGCTECCENVTFTVSREEKERDFPHAIEVEDLLTLESRAARTSGTYSYSYYLHD